MPGCFSIYLETGEDIPGLDDLVLQLFGAEMICEPSNRRYRCYSGKVPETYISAQPLLIALSSQVPCDVVAMGWVSSRSSFAFFRCRNGAVIRALIYGCQRDVEWDLVEGSPEAWELDQLFSEEALAGPLKYASEEKIVEWRSRWEVRSFGPGDFEPWPPSPHELAALLEFPDYG